jgi:hypothetical protein
MQMVKATAAAGQSALWAPGGSVADLAALTAQVTVMFAAKTSLRCAARVASTIQIHKWGFKVNTTMSGRSCPRKVADICPLKPAWATCR